MRNIIIFAAALMALSILPVNAKAANLEMDEKKPRIIITEEDEKSPTRSPIVYDVDMTVESVNNTFAIVSSQYGYTAYFQTDSNGWATVTINGKMPGSTVYKYMMGATLYEGYDNSNGNDDENDEGGAEQRADE
ncbi:MAG: hypothetical protein IJR56_00975 [Bacteroidaceae bacterium]|nr:hypothetical protein [Bacteroidaceae bacterium]MBQ9882836.1 hypothetical protein [Bacteroidaceae bacterium]